jgi:hypothetical protein
MKTIFTIITDSKGTQYKQTAGGTYYDIETPDNLVKILENARETRKRLKIYLGDNKTGRDWGEEYGKFCTIGRSCGNIKIPLSIANKRSTGGGALLDSCIVKLVDVKTKIVLYQHPNYKPLNIEIVKSDLTGYTHNLLIDGNLYSRHKSEKKALLLKSKLL